MSDGSLLMLSTFLSGADFFSLTNVIAKTDTLGNIDGCEEFPSCLKSANLTLPIDTFNVMETTPDLDTLPPVELLIDSITFSFSDYCDIPPAPSPGFSVPDTICVMGNITAVASGSTDAQGISWQLEGNGVDSSLMDSATFQYQFNLPGTYTLSQKIWFLGCSHSEQQTITVLPNLEAKIEPDEALCEPPANLFVHSNRPLLSFDWNTGETSPNIDVIENGLFAVTVSDGYCTATDDADISFVNFLLDNQPPLILPPDTTICQQDLPYQLTPRSAFSDEFLLDSGQQTNLPMMLDNEGNYNISAEGG